MKRLNRLSLFESHFNRNCHFPKAREYRMPSSLPCSNASLLPKTKRQIARIAKKAIFFGSFLNTRPVPEKNIEADPPKINTPFKNKLPISISHLQKKIYLTNLTQIVTSLANFINHSKILPTNIRYSTFNILPLSSTLLSPRPRHIHCRRRARPIDRHPP